MGQREIPLGFARRILYKNCKPLRKSALAATWRQCPDLAGSTPAPIQKKREPALTGQLSFCYDDKIGTRYKRGQKIRDHHRSDRSHESSLTYVRLTRPSFACAKFAQGKSAGKKSRDHHRSSDRELPGVQPLVEMAGIDQRFFETLLARTPTRKRVGPVSPLLAKNVPPARFIYARTLSGPIPAF